MGCNRVPKPPASRIPFMVYLVLPQRLSVSLKIRRRGPGGVRPPCPAAGPHSARHGSSPTSRGATDTSRWSRQRPARNHARPSSPWRLLPWWGRSRNGNHGPASRSRTGWGASAGQPDWAPNGQARRIWRAPLPVLVPGWRVPMQ